MSEKKGLTGKLTYDFNTAAVCEVCIKDTWYRTTAREFRSFDGSRRLTQPVKPLGLGEDIVNTPMETIEYNGPVYVLYTNDEVIRMDTQTIVTNPFMPKVQKSLPNSSRI
jgi:hypothetical protein